MEKKLSTILGIFLLLVSCSDIKVKRTESNIDYTNRTIIFLDHTGDTIIKCQTNETPEFEIERLVGKDSKTYYVRLDSTEYLELYVHSDMISTITWQIKKRK
jgi:hypothetical protein